MKLEGVKGGVKRKGTKILGAKETKILYFALLLVLVHLHVLNIGFLSHFFFSQNLDPFLFTPPLPSIPISHQPR